MKKKRRIRRRPVKRKINIDKIKPFVVIVGLLLFFMAIKVITTKNKEFITKEVVSTYINIVDNASNYSEQLNWQEVVAIYSVLGNKDLMVINENKVKEVCKLFYKDDEVLALEKVLESGFTEEEKKTVEKNYEKLEKISLRSLRGDNEEYKKKFIEDIKEYAIDNYKNKGVLPSITISQGILESNWGRSSLASKHNNYFGIKSNKAWTGKVVSFETGEFYNDKINANFRAYDSMKESVDDLGRFLTLNKRYEEKGLFKNVNYKNQAQALEDAGYATKTNENGEKIYADLLIELIIDNNLMIYDNIVLHE